MTILRWDILAATALAGSLAANAADTVRFNRDIRPIFSDTCFNCHGPDKNTRKTEMRLDIRDVATNKTTKTGVYPIVPGQPEKSEIIRRIFSDDPKVIMPHPESHKTLTEKQKNAIKQWVTEGAKYEQHWAYLPLVRPAVPKNGAKDAIDAYILAALAEKNIKPSPEADRATLLRRLSLDITGLPPSPEDVAAFVADKSPDAYEKQVDRLLASVRFGERMASWWLDVAHMADTVGFHGDQNQRIFPYRDYVINTFNSNKPFNQFVTEQIAGDLLPNATVEQRVASGFNRLNMMTREGGAQPKEYLAKYGAERVRTIGTAFLGSTFGCCECHDHKFDPIKTKDFYSMQAFFADMKQWGVYADYGYTPEPELKGINNESPFPPEVLTDVPYFKQREAKIRGQIAALAKSAAQDAATKAGLESWVRDVAAFVTKNPSGWATPSPEVGTAMADEKAKKAAKAKASEKGPPPEFEVLADGRVLFDKGAADNTTIKLMPGAMRVAAIRLELIPDAKHNNSIVRGGAMNSEMVKPAVSLTKKGAAKPAALTIRYAEADFKEPRISGGLEIPGVLGGWRTSAKDAGKKQTSVWQLDAPQQLADGDVIEVKLDGNKVGCIRISLSPIATIVPESPEDMASFAAAVTKPDAAANDAVAAAWLAGSVVPSARDETRMLLARVYQCHGGKMWSLTTEHIEKPLTIRVLPRGNWMDQTGEIVLPASPSFLPGGVASTTNNRLTRLDLAKWICSTSNPLTARAVMNRLWKQFFGNGLSMVVDDLGAQGEPPSHPELLDWISTEFRDGWDVKHMVKLFVMSSTYRQSSSLRPELRDVDPNNRLLASQNPRRLDAEFVRDNALAIAGLLNLDGVGGPSVKPYQPGGYYANLQFPNRDYVATDDDEQWRRGLYMHWQRTFLHPMLANFDAPARDECAAARNVSSTPQQALTLLNDPTFVEAARVFAARVMKEVKSSDDARIDRAYELALAREPKPSERESLKKFLTEQLDYFKANAADAEKFVSTGIAPKADLAPVEHAAWTAVCHVVLNLHESITRY